MSRKQCWRAKAVCAGWFWLLAAVAWYWDLWGLLVAGLVPYLITFYVCEDTYGRYLEQSFKRYDEAARRAEDRYADSKKIE